MNAPERSVVAPVTVEFQLDGRLVQAYEGETILQAADRHGVTIPRLCYMPGYRPDGNCRSCMVEIEGERVLAPSCCRNVTANMKVRATSERAVKSQKMVLEMLLSDVPARGHKWIGDDETRQHGELSDWAARMKVAVLGGGGLLARHLLEELAGHEVIALDRAACDIGDLKSVTWRTPITSCGSSPALVARIIASPSASS